MPVGPRREVTLLFTDIEGSTALLHHLGDDAYAELLTAHRVVVRDRITAHRGSVVGIEGDSFFAVFEGPADAVACAADTQQTLARQPWPAATRPRVRMGLHTGPARADGDGYIGLAVHQAARIAAAAYGDQVLLSAATAAAIGSTWSTRSLGRHRLKDLPDPIELIQLLVEGLPETFPPPRSLDRVRHSIPLQPSSFLGRSEELGTGLRLLDETRCLTLLGPGGTGKTRLAYALAENCVDAYPDGVWVAELAGIVEDAEVPRVLARSMGVRPQPGVAAIDAVVEELRHRAALVVVDNCEHLIDAAADLVHRLLRGCADVTVIATSREPLHIGGEHVWSVPPMRVGGESQSEVASNDATQLFLRRAEDLDDTFALTADNAAAIAEICTAVDGMPLAIELAAALVRELSPADIASRLGHSLDVLARGWRGADPRQASLRGAIDWSYRLLTPGQQTLFARLAAFAGSWSAEAAAAVCAPADELEALVAKSLVVRSVPAEGATPRYRFLDAIRQYAEETLDADPTTAKATRARLADWAERLAHDAGAQQVGTREEAAAFDRLDPEDANVAAALDALHAEGESARAATIALSLAEFWALRGHWAAGERAIERCLAVPDLPASTRASLLAGQGQLLASTGNYDGCRDSFAAAAELARQAGDRRHEGRYVAGLGRAAFAVSDFTGSIAHYRAALDVAREVGDRSAEGRWLGELGNIAWNLGDYNDSWQWTAQAIAIARETGDRRREGIWTGNLGDICASQGDDAQARIWHEQALAIAREVGDGWYVANWVGRLGESAARRGEYDEARQLLDEALSIVTAMGDRRYMSTWLAALGRLALFSGDLAQANERLGEALAIAESVGSPRQIAFISGFLAQVANDEGRARDAARLLTEAWRLFLEIGSSSGLARFGWERARAHIAIGTTGAARAVLLDAIDRARDQGISTLEPADTVAVYLGAIGDWPGCITALGAGHTRRLDGAVGSYPARDHQRQRVLDLARAAVPDRSFEAAWGSGLNLSADGVLAVLAELVAASDPSGGEGAVHLPDEYLGGLRRPQPLTARAADPHGVSR